MSLFPLHKPSFPCFEIEGYQEIEVFENQVHGLLGWTADTARYTDETGVLKAPFKYLQLMQCPRGFKWVTDWLINRDYTSMDSHGWSYATSFTKLSQKLIDCESDGKPTPRQNCRRRLWFRIVQPVDSAAFANIPRAVSTPMHIYRVYENQKFSITQGGWITYNFISARCADERVTSAVEYKSLDSIPCEKGYLWAMEWYKDKYYTKMGPGGWSYGTTPERIIDKYIQQCSDSEPTFRHKYRRRLWYRRMRPMEPTDVADSALKQVLATGGFNAYVVLCCGDDVNNTIDFL
jgi:hypothetical protein